MFFSYSQEVYSEVPDEITLALSISGCPLKCHHCHSAETWQSDFGEKLTIERLNQLLCKHKYCSCVLFYGGEWLLDELTFFISHIKTKNLKVCLYTGLDLTDFTKEFLYNLDYIKTGKYIHRLGGLQSPTTNQRFYKIHNTTITDITNTFNTKKPNN